MINKKGINQRFATCVNLKNMYMLDIRDDFTKGIRRNFQDLYIYEI